MSESEEDVDLDPEFDEAIQQLDLLQRSHEVVLERLSWLRSQLRSDTDLDAFLDELHQAALQEIEQTGQSSFGATLLDRIEKLKKFDPIQ